MKNNSLAFRSNQFIHFASAAIEKFSKIKTLVIGDLMVDEYLWGSVERISQEAPVQIVEVTKQEYRLGGTGNVVNNLCALGASVSVASVIGSGFHRDFVFDELKRLKVGTDCLLIDDNRPMTKKTRVLASNQQIVRIDFESRNSISTKYENQIQGFLNENKKQYDVILISDYSKGVITDRIASDAINYANKAKIPIVIDPKGKYFSKYNKATLLTPNLREATVASGIEIVDDISAEKAAKVLLTETRCNAVVITRGKNGMTLVQDRNAEITHIPAQAREVYDVSGAGDTVAAVLGLAIGSGLSFRKACSLANLAGGIVVGKLGTSPVNKAELLYELNRDQKKSNSSKERDLKELINLSQNLKKAKKQVVYLSDDFSTLNGKHIELIKKAKSKGDVLVVGISYDHDAYNRDSADVPFIPKRECVKLISALEYVDYIVVTEDKPDIEIIESLKPAIIVKSGNLSQNKYSKKPEKGILGKYVEKIVKLD